MSGALSLLLLESHVVSFISFPVSWPQDMNPPTFPGYLW